MIMTLRAVPNLADEGSVLRGNVPLRLGGIEIAVQIRSAVASAKSTTKRVCTGEAGARHKAALVSQVLECGSCSRRGKAADFLTGEEGVKGLKVLTAKSLGGSKSMPIEAMDVRLHDQADVAAATVVNGSIYYVTLDWKAPQADVESYAVVRELLRRKSQLGFYTRWTLRGTTSMWQLGVRGEVITLQRLEWPASIRSAPAVPRQRLSRLAIAHGQRAAELATLPFDVTAYTPDAEWPLSGDFSREGLAA